jgi:YHS domain-containing protein
MCPGDIPVVKKEVKETTGKSTNVVMQTTCPVMGGKIDKTSYVDVAGKRIYLCCAGCAGAVKADPEKYIKKLEGEGVTLDAAAPVADKKK